MPIQAGRLRERVTIQATTRTPDGGGGFTEAWGDVATVWARVEALTGTEAWRAMQVASSVSHRITIRQRDVRPQQRIKHGPSTYRIRSVRADERGEAVELMCEQEFV